MAKKESWLTFPLRLSQEVDRLFDELIYRPWGTGRGGAADWNPELDLYETEDAFVLEVDVPGVKEEDIAVEIDNHDLVLRGRRVCERVTTESNFHRHERREGQFQRRIALSASVDREHIRAAFQEGVLRVTLPKVRKEAE
ncbi:MAG: Hsp20/alpha crystallin family protein [Candidatus Binatia bacterium]